MFDLHLQAQVGLEGRIGYLRKVGLMNDPEDSFDEVVWWDMLLFWIHCFSLQLMLVVHYMHLSVHNLDLYVFCIDHPSLQPSLPTWPCSFASLVSQTSTY